MKTRSLIGASPPLGYDDTERPARLQEEMSPNDGTAAMRQRTLGSVAVEGLGDATDWQEAPARGGNYTICCNRHLAEFASAQNNHSTRFVDI